MVRIAVGWRLVESSVVFAMNKLILPVAIFFSVILAGKVAEHYAVEGSWRIGLLCLVAMVVQIVVSRIQRARRENAES